LRGYGANLTDEDAAFSDLWGNKIGLQIVRGNRAAVKVLVDEAFEARRPSGGGPILSTPLAELGFDNRACNALERYLGISTVEQLLAADESAVLSIPNVGSTMLLAMVKALALKGIRRSMQLETELAE